MTEQPSAEKDTQRQVYFRLSPGEDQKMWEAFREGRATEALNLIITTHVAREHHAGLAERADALAQAAAWVADALGYPVEVRMPDSPVPKPLWDALVDHIHADESGNWHGNTLDREVVESWLADEAGRDFPSAEQSA